MTARIRALLLLQRPEAWINIATVWEAMLSNANFEPTVLLLPYSVEDPQTSARKASITRALLQAEGVPFVEWHEDWPLKRGAFDAIVINHPYDRERPRGLWFDKLSDAANVTIYIPYGPVMAGGKKNLRLQFAQPTQIGSSGVVARSDWESNMYARHCTSGNSHVYVLGHPRFDRLLRDLGRPTPLEMADAIDGRLAILWNSHFSFAPAYSQSSNFSTFDLIGPELFRYAKENRDWLAIVWRPHPGLFPVIVREGLLSLDELVPLEAELTSVGILLDKSPGHVDAFKASDALITDVGSFLLEYLVTGKPILALINSEGEPLNEESEALVANYSRASTPEDVMKFIEALHAGSAVPDAASVRSEHLPGLDGHAGERVARLIENLVMSHNGPHDQYIALPPSVQIFDHRHPPKSGQAPLRPVLESIAPETPALDRLILGLQQLRDQKAHESAWRKGIRSSRNSIRTSVGEAVKRSPTLMQIAETLRMVRRRKS